MRLELRGVAAKIGRRTVLDDVDLTVDPGESVGVVGVNGSGKSTLLRVAAGLRTTARGSVLLDGADVSSLGARRRAQRIALVAQEAVPPPDLLVRELVAMGRTPHRSAWCSGQAGELDLVCSALEAVGMEGSLHAPCGHLSGGERRRVMLARGIAQGTDVLLLDEPTNHLDVRHQIELIAAVRALGRTLVAAVHDLDLALRAFDRVVVLHEGRVDACGPPFDVLTPERVATVFGVRAARVRHPDTGSHHLLLEGLA